MTAMAGTTSAQSSATVAPPWWATVATIRACPHALESRGSHATLLCAREPSFLCWEETNRQPQGRVHRAMPHIKKCRTAIDRYDNGGGGGDDVTPQKSTCGRPQANMLVEVGLGLYSVMDDVGRTAAHAIHATCLSTTQAHRCARLLAVPSPCRFPRQSEPWHDGQVENVLAKNAWPTGLANKGLDPRLFLRPKLEEPAEPAHKAHNACATRVSSCTVHNNQGLNRKVCPCPRPQGCAQTANATQRQQPQEKSIARTLPLTTRLGSAPSTKGTTYNKWHCKNTETCQRQGMTTLASTRCATSTHTEL